MGVRQLRTVYPRSVPRKWRTTAVQRVCWYALLEVWGRPPTVHELEDHFNTLRGQVTDLNATTGDQRFEFFWLWQAFNQAAAFTGRELDDFTTNYELHHQPAPGGLPRAVEDRVQKIIDVVTDLAVPISAAADAVRRTYNAVRRVASFVDSTFDTSIVSTYEAWQQARLDSAKANILDPLKARFNKALDVLVRETTVEMNKAQDVLDKPVTLRSSDEIKQRLLAPINYLRGLVNGSTK